MLAKRKKEVNGYTSILNEVIKDPRLTDKEYRVLMVLLAYYNQKDGHAYPSAKRIEEEANISNTWRKQIIKNLIKKRRIKRTFRRGKNNLFTFPCHPFPENEKETKTKTKKKPYYGGCEMRKVFGEWKVIGPDKEWREFNDDEKNITWK